MRTRVQRFFRSSDAILVAFLLLLVIAIFYATKDYPKIPWEDGGSPDFFPRFLAVLLAGLGCAAAVEGVLKAEPLARPDLAASLRVLAGLAVLATTPYLLGLLGFRATTAAVSLAMMVIFVEWREMTLGKAVVMIATAVGVAVLLGFAFEDLAGRRLPRSTLF
jgi:hypothetical protein